MRRQSPLPYIRYWAVVKMLHCSGTAAVPPFLRSAVQPSMIYVNGFPHNSHHSHGTDGSGEFPANVIITIMHVGAGYTVRTSGENACDCGGGQVPRIAF